MRVIHNNCTFEIVRYFDKSSVIEIKPLNGVFTSGEESIYKTESIDNITTNFGGGFEEWVKDNY